MRRTTILICVILGSLLLLAPAVANGQSYDKLSKAIAKLDSTLKVIVEKQKGQQPATQQLADVEGAAAATLRPVNDVSGVYELASDLEGVVAQLQGVVTEAKEAEKSRPQNIASTGHGKIVFSGLFQQQYYTKEGAQKSSTFDARTAQFGTSGSLNQWAKVGFLGDFAKSPRLLDAFISLMPNKYWTIDFGQYKPPFGTDFLKSSSGMFFVNNFKGQSLGTVRDVGADVSLKHI